MIIERIESAGLAHHSYLVGDQGKAVVIDPRRDVDVYIEKAVKRGYRLGHVLETHRNEDYVVGSLELAARTGAQVWHADAQLEYGYGRPIEEGQSWSVGSLRLEAIHTPGHTPGSVSYLLYEATGAPWMVFTGDALMAGDVGRVDLFGMDRAEELAGLLYDSLFGKVLPLGDHILVCPAHGAGSVCGNVIADRLWTTVGLERQLNPKLQASDRDAFLEQVVEELERPPYFRQMEKWNVEGAPLMGTLPVPTPLSADAFREEAKDALVLDVRDVSSFGAAHVPQALSIWQEEVARYAGWFLPYDRPLLLVGPGDDLTEPVRTLSRLGLEVTGCLAGGMQTWHQAGLESWSLQMVTTQSLCERLDRGQEAWILDVRSGAELEQTRIAGAHHIHITQLPGRMDEVPTDLPVYVFCGSGLRSTIAASLLRIAGWRNQSVVLGGLAGWTSTVCPVELVTDRGG
ncbi:MAG: MBL fold metallo-hydrolase [Anaerolineae bacterium]